MAEKSPTADGVLKPAETSIRPVINAASARSLVESLYGLTVTSIQELNSYDDRNFLVKVEHTHANKHLGQVCSEGYILKILNSFDSLKEHACESIKAVLYLYVSHGTKT